MNYSNYKIPEKITAEDTFMYTLVEKMHQTGYNYGAVMGSFRTLITHLKENNVSSELIEEAENVLRSVNTHLNEYDTEIYGFVSQRWSELGKPLSLAAHQARKEYFDAQDAHKEEYGER